MQGKGADLTLKSNSSKDLLFKYVDVIKSGDVKKLEEMLSDNIVTHAGGGGKAGKAVEVTAGINAVALLLVRSYEMYLRKLQIAFKDVNNSPAALFYNGPKLVGCQLFDINTDTNKITNIYFIAGRKKLQGL